MGSVLTLTEARLAEPDWNVTTVRARDGHSREEPNASSPDVETLPERELIEACLAGRADAFELIVRRHQRPVYQLCYRFTRNHEDASDLAQEVFLRAYRGLSRFRGDASIGTWLHRIGVNVCLNRASVRKPVGQPLDEAAYLDAGAESPVDELVRLERAARVKSAMAALPPKQRAALILRVYQDLPHREIATILGSTVGAVKANVFHALRNLKRALGDREP